MDIKYGDIILRDFCLNDIDDEIRWMNVETEWMKEDNPWDDIEPVNEESLRKEMLDIMDSTPQDAIRSRLEIVTGGNHIGFVCAYPFKIDDSSGEMDCSLKSQSATLALGIEICEPVYWNKGFGSQALAAWINYYLDNRISEIFLETWSGNVRMVKCAKKLGFNIYKCLPGYRTVDGVAYDALIFKLDIGFFRSAIR